MNTVAAFNRTYTRLVRKEVAGYERDAKIEREVYGREPEIDPLDEAVLTQIMARTIEHMELILAKRIQQRAERPIPIWAGLERHYPITRTWVFGPIV